VGRPIWSGANLSRRKHTRKVGGQREHFAFHFAMAHLQCHRVAPVRRVLRVEIVQPNTVGLRGTGPVAKPDHACVYCTMTLWGKTVGKNIGVQTNFKTVRSGVVWRAELLTLILCAFLPPPPPYPC
jgi:hypothetical protein